MGTERSVDHPKGSVPAGEHVAGTRPIARAGVSEVPPMWHPSMGKLSAQAPAATADPVQPVPPTPAKKAARGRPPQRR